MKGLFSQSIKNKQTKVPSFMNPFKNKQTEHLHPQPGSLQNHGIFGRTRKNPPSPANDFLGRITLGTLSGKGVSIFLSKKKKKKRWDAGRPMQRHERANSTKRCLSPIRPMHARRQSTGNLKKDKGKTGRRRESGNLNHEISPRLARRAAG